MLSSRRLTGPNLYASRGGAVLEVELDPAYTDAAVRAWRNAVVSLLARVGWSGEEIVVRQWPGGAGMFITAPVDALLAATEVNEQALLLVLHDHPALSPADPSLLPPAHRSPITSHTLDDIAARLQVHIRHERNGPLSALAAEARARDLVFSFDDDTAAVGSGTGVHTWPLALIPGTGAIDWRDVHDVPVALVTGSNGKTTTVRLLAAMLREAGHVTGYSCTNGVYVGIETVVTGDWAGPAGARLVLHDPRVTAAVLETARGGILRRGLATTRADVAVVTRVAPDHIGEYGIHDTASLGEAKLVVARALRPGAPLVLNADDDTLVAWSRHHATAVTWFSLDTNNPVLRAHVLGGGTACLLHHEVIVLAHQGTRAEVLPAAACPLTLGGAARFNIANALAATAAAHGLGVSLDAMRRALRTFGASLGDNPGRLHVLHREGVTVVVDFVHNPDGWRALFAAVRGLATGRVILTLGQAGDREDDALRDLADAVAAGAPDVIVLKEMAVYLRGRPPGEITALLAQALRERGVAPAALRYAEDELSAVHTALGEARPGDLVVLAVHSSYVEVMELLGATTGAWTPAPR